MHPYADVVDLDEYPIDRLDSPEGRAFLDRSRAELAEHGVCTLAGFIRPDAVATMVSLAESLAPRAWASDQSHTVYFETPDETVDPKDPRAWQVRSAKHGIAYDYIPADAPLRRLYESDDMTGFIAAVVGVPQLYRSADPLDALQITSFGDGEELGWHFDRSEFSVTVMYRRAGAGGEFDYVPGLRSPEDPFYAETQSVLQGDHSRALRLHGNPGDLAIFRGRYAMHRVTEVVGEPSRLNSVLTYGQVPDMRLNDLTSQLFYGRTSPRD